MLANAEIKIDVNFFAVIQAGNLHLVDLDPWVFSYDIAVSRLSRSAFLLFITRSRLAKNDPRDINVVALLVDK